MEPSHPGHHSQDTLSFYQFAHVDTAQTTDYSSKSVDESELYDKEALHGREHSHYKIVSRAFFAVSVVSAILVLALESYMYGNINENRGNIQSNQRFTVISIYLALFIFAAVYQLLLTYIGLRTKNMMLLAMLCLFYAFLLVYTGVQYHEVSRALEGNNAWRVAARATNIAAIGVLAVTLVSQSAMLYLLREHVKWFRFKKIGADMRIRRMYNTFQIHRCLLIFDFFFFLGFTLQFLVIMVNNKASVEFILTVVVIPLTIVLILVADFATTREIIWLTVAAIILFCCGVAYVLFKTIRLYTKYTSAFNVTVKPGAYFPGRQSMVAFGAITATFLLVTIASEVVVLLNYGEGLLPLVSTSYKFLPGHTSPNPEDDTSTEKYEVID